MKDRPIQICDICLLEKPFLRMEVVGKDKVKVCHTCHERITRAKDAIENKTVKGIRSGISGVLLETPAPTELTISMNHIEFISVTNGYITSIDTQFIREDYDLWIVTVAQQLSAPGPAYLNIVGYNAAQELVETVPIIQYIYDTDEGMFNYENVGSSIKSFNPANKVSTLSLRMTAPDPATLEFLDNMFTIPNVAAMPSNLKITVEVD